jgi:hypothetical protein
VTGVLAPFVGKIVDRSHPRPVVGFGFSVLAIALTWLSIEMTPTTPIWRLVLPLTAMGIGMAFIWSPLAATATRNLPPQLAGAGSGVYNATRQVGSVLGSAGMAAFMTSRISAEMPPMPAEAPQSEGSVIQLPAFLHEPFAAAMSQSLLLPAFFALLGVIAALFLLGFGNKEQRAVDDYAASLDEADRSAGYAVEYGGDETFVDDDEYLEYTVSWDDPEPEPQPAAVLDEADDSDTEPMRSRAEHLLHAPAETWPDAPVESWRHWGHLQPEGRGDLFDDEPTDPTLGTVVEPPPPPPAPVSSPPPEPPRQAWRSILDELQADVPSTSPPVEPAVEPIGFAHNGFHVDEEERFQPLAHPDPLAEPKSPVADAYTPDFLRGEYSTGSHARHESPGEYNRPARHHLPEDEPPSRPFWFESNGRHSRADDPDDASSYGRHSMPGRD